MQDSQPTSAFHSDNITASATDTLVGVLDMQPPYAGCETGRSSVWQRGPVSGPWTSAPVPAR